MSDASGPHSARRMTERGARAGGGWGGAPSYLFARKVLSIFPPPLPVILHSCKRTQTRLFVCARSLPPSSLCPPSLSVSVSVSFPLRWTLPSTHACTSCWTVGSWGRARQSTQPARAGVNPKRRDVSPSRPSWCHLLLPVPPFTSQSPPPASSRMAPPMLPLQSSMAISGCFCLDALSPASHPEWSMYQRERQPAPLSSIPLKWVPAGPSSAWWTGVPAAQAWQSFAAPPASLSIPS